MKREFIENYPVIFVFKMQQKGKKSKQTGNREKDKN